MISKQTIASHSSPRHPQTHNTLQHMAQHNPSWPACHSCLPNFAWNHLWHHGSAHGKNHTAFGRMKMLAALESGSHHTFPKWAQMSSKCGGGRNMRDGSMATVIQRRACLAGMKHRCMCSLGRVCVRWPRAETLT